MLPVSAVLHALLVGGGVSALLLMGAFAEDAPLGTYDVPFTLTVLVTLAAHVFFLSGGPKAWRVAKATIGRAWRVMASYRFQLVALALQMVVLGVLLVVLGRPIITLLFGPIGAALEGYQTTNFVIFVMLGTAAFPVLWSAYQVSAVRLRNEQMTGMFEAMVATPAGLRALPFAYFVAAVASSIVSLAALLTLFHFLVPADALAVTQPHALVTFAAILAPALVGMWGLGLVIGGLTAAFKMADAASRTLRVVLLVFGGMYIPLVFLPVWAQKIAYVLPVTYAGEGIRAALAEETLATEMPGHFAFLVAFALLASTLGMWAYSRLLDRARRAGNLAGY